MQYIYNLCDSDPIDENVIKKTEELCSPQKCADNS